MASSSFPINPSTIMLLKKGANDRGPADSQTGVFRLDQTLPYWKRIDDFSTYFKVSDDVYVERIQVATHENLKEVTVTIIDDHGQIYSDRLEVKEDGYVDFNERVIFEAEVFYWIFIVCENRTGLFFSAQQRCPPFVEYDDDGGGLFLFALRYSPMLRCIVFDKFENKMN